LMKLKNKQARHGSSPEMLASPAEFLHAERKKEAGDLDSRELCRQQVWQKWIPQVKTAIKATNMKLRSRSALLEWLPVFNPIPHSPRAIDWRFSLYDCFWKAIQLTIHAHACQAVNTFDGMTCNAGQPPVRTPPFPDAARSGFAGPAFSSRPLY